MDSDKWLEFTVVTGLEKFKDKLIKMIRGSKKLKDNFDYMRLISVVYFSMNVLVDDVEEICK